MLVAKYLLPFFVLQSCSVSELPTHGSRKTAADLNTQDSQPEASAEVLREPWGQIQENLIEGNDRYGVIGNAPPYLTTSRIGLHFVNSYGDLCSNIFDKSSYAMQFQGDCNQGVGTKLITNEINECRYGVVVRNYVSTGGINTPGMIGDQGSEDETHGNIFTGDFNNPDGYRTYCINSDGSRSPFYVFDIDNDEPAINGTNSALPAIQRLPANTTESWSCGASKTSFFAEQDTSKELEQRMTINVNVFPNPANYTAEIAIKGTDSPVLLEVFNIMGQSVLSVMVSGNSSFQVNNFKPGVYLLKFTGSNGAYFNSRLVVLR